MDSLKPIHGPQVKKPSLSVMEMCCLEDRSLFNRIIIIFTNIPMSGEESEKSEVLNPLLTFL